MKLLKMEELDGKRENPMKCVANQLRNPILVASHSARASVMLALDDESVILRFKLKGLH